MKPAPFTYHRATSIEDAISTLRAGEGMVKVLAGGQSLVPMLNLRLAPVDHLVDLGGIAELRIAERTHDGARYGALVSHADFEDGIVPDVTNGLMAHVARHLAYRAVRTRGTIGGSLALADPAADWLSTTIALEATLDIADSEGRRTVPVSEFVVGPYFSMIGDDEIIVAVKVRQRSESERWGYYKVAVKVGEYAKSLSIALVDRERATARIVLGATDSAPLQLPATADAVLSGKTGDALRGAIREELAASECDFTPANLIMHTTCVERAITRATV